MTNGFSKKVAKVYDTWAPTYDRESNPAITAEKDHAIDLLDPQESDIVLEIGCGTGRNLRKLVKKTKNVYGIDISKNMLELAKKSVPETNISIANAEKDLGFRKEMFDKILCSFVISHIQNTKAFFKEVSRILKKRGILVITTIHPDANFDDYEPTGDRFRLMQYNINLQHDADDLIKDCESAGLHVESTQDVMIDGLEEYFTKESYQKIKGTPFLLILKVRNDS